MISVVIIATDQKPYFGITPSVSLSATGHMPATHYGAHAWLEDELIDAADCVVDCLPDGDHAGHFDNVCKTLGLSPIEAGYERDDPAQIATPALVKA